MDGTRAPGRQMHASAIPLRDLQSPPQFVRGSFALRRPRRITPSPQQTGGACETMLLPLRFLTAENKIFGRAGRQMAVSALGGGGGRIFGPGGKNSYSEGRGNKSRRAPCHIVLR